MTNDDVLHAVAEAISIITGKQYEVDYYPALNVSEKASGIRRTVSPGRGHREKINRAVLRKVLEVVVEVFAPLPPNPQGLAIAVQEELDLIQDNFILNGGPCTGLYCKAADSTPPVGAGVDTASLVASPSVVIGAVILTFEWF